MRPNVGFAVLLLATSVAVAAEESPYAGLTDRDIKALSQEQIRSYLEGSGMGFAMPAELNSYPGPKHVLELWEDLALNEAQRGRVQQSFDAMHEAAVRLGAEIVAKERDLDALFAGGAADERRLHSLAREIGALEGELRFAHLRAHLETREVLTPAQLLAYDRLRGYGEGGHGGHHPGGHGEHGGHGGHAGHRMSAGSEDGSGSTGER